MLAPEGEPDLHPDRVEHAATISGPGALGGGRGRCHEGHDARLITHLREQLEQFFLIEPVLGHEFADESAHIGACRVIDFAGLGFATRGIGGLGGNAAWHQPGQNGQHGKRSEGSEMEQGLHGRDSRTALGLGRNRGLVVSRWVESDNAG